MIYYPTILYQETHNIGCICGACNNTACLATIRVPIHSPEEYASVIKQLRVLRGLDERE